MPTDELIRIKLLDNKKAFDVLMFNFKRHLVGCN